MKFFFNMLLMLMFFGGFAGFMWGYTGTLKGNYLFGDFMYQEYLLLWIFIVFSLLLAVIFVLVNFSSTEEIHE